MPAGTPSPPAPLSPSQTEKNNSQNRGIAPVTNTGDRTMPTAACTTSATAAVWAISSGTSTAWTGVQGREGRGSCAPARGTHALAAPLGSNALEPRTGGRWIRSILSRTAGPCRLLGPGGPHRARPHDCSKPPSWKLHTHLPHVPQVAGGCIGAQRHVQHVRPASRHGCPASACGMASLPSITGLSLVCQAGKPSPVPESHHAPARAALYPSKYKLRPAILLLQLPSMCLKMQ